MLRATGADGVGRAVEERCDANTGARLWRLRSNILVYSVIVAVGDPLRKLPHFATLVRKRGSRRLVKMETAVEPASPSGVRPSSPLGLLAERVSILRKHIISSRGAHLYSDA